MAQSFRIETLDRSGRWYLTPGAQAVYDLRIRNDSKGAADCSLVVEDPVSGVNIEPAAFSLGGHEVRTVTVTFASDTPASRSQRVLVSLHSDSDGSLLTTFEQPLVLTGGSDCSVAMAYKGPLLDGDRLRGFEMACSVRSQSEGRSTFRVALTPHPAFSCPALPDLDLDPGQSGEVVVPIGWDRDVKDALGWNHPAILEIAVAVSNGRRTSRMRWELIEAKLESHLRRVAAGGNGKAVAPAGRSQAAAARAVATAPSPALLYLLNGCVEQLMLAAPVLAAPMMLPGTAAPSQPADVVAPAQPAFIPTTPVSAKPPKLTPYTPTRWNGADAPVTPAAAAPAAAAPAGATPATAPATPPTPVMPAHVVRERQIEQLRRNHPVPAALLIGGLALVALVVAAVFGFKSSVQQSPSTTRVTVAAPAVAIDTHQRLAQPALLAAATSIRSVTHAKPAARPIAHQATAAVAPVAATPAPATAVAATARPAAPRRVALAPAPRHAFPHIKLYQPESGPVVALGEIQAYYGPRGRAVQVYWGAAEQASAKVQLIDDHGAVVSSAAVRGARQYALLYLPRRFHGALTVQVSSIGRMGERVANTASLPPFGG